MSMWDKMRPTQQVIHQALDDLILKHSDMPWARDAIKTLEKIAKETDKSMYEVMEMIVNDMTDKGFYKFGY